jgi:hypothetical protein
MDMSWSINCIEYREPLLWVSLTLGTFLGVLVARFLATILRRKAVSRPTLILVAAVLSAPLAVVASYVILAVLYAVTHGGIACVHFVRPALAIPPFVCAAATLLVAYRSDASVTPI